MSCFNPITAWRLKDLRDGSTEIKFIQPKKDKKHITVEELQLPCWKCIGCLLDKSNSWATRCWCEASNWQKNCFITLTYNDRHLPKNGLLKKRHLQLFMKKLRYFHTGIEEWENPRTGKIEKPIRFLACGEYGPSGTHRPHYHILIFNWKPARLEFYKYNKDGDIIYKCKEIQKIWGKGFITVEDMNYRTACYVARYTQKKLFKELDAETIKKQNLQPEFIDMSRNGGIGIKYWLDNKEEILKKQGIYIKVKDKVKNKQIPQYFERKLKDEDEKRFNKYKALKQLHGMKIMKEILEKTSLDEYDYKKMLEQRLLEKAQKLRRDNFI